MDISIASLGEIEAMSAKLARRIGTEKEILNQLKEKLRNVELEIETEKNKVQLKTQLKDNLLEKQSQLGNSITSLQTSRMVINNLLIDSKNQLNFQEKNTLNLEKKLKKTHMKYEKYWEDHQKTYLSYPKAKDVEEEHKKIKQVKFQYAYVQREIENLHSALNRHRKIRDRQNQLSIIRIAEHYVKSRKMAESNKNTVEEVRLLKAQKEKLQEDVNVLTQKSQTNWKGNLRKMTEKPHTTKLHDLFLKPFPAVALGKKGPAATFQKPLLLPQLKIPVFTSALNKPPVITKIPSMSNFPTVEVPFSGKIIPEDKLADDGGQQYSLIDEVPLANNMKDRSEHMLVGQNPPDIFLAEEGEEDQQQQKRETENIQYLRRSTSQSHYALQSFARVPEVAGPLPLQNNTMPNQEQSDEPAPKKLCPRKATENAKEADVSSNMMEFQTQDQESCFLVPATRSLQHEDYPVISLEERTEDNSESEIASNTDVSEVSEPQYIASSPIFSPPLVSAPSSNAGTSFSFAPSSFSSSMPSFSFGGQQKTPKQSGAWNFF